MYGFCGWTGSEQWNTTAAVEAVSQTLGWEGKQVISDFAGVAAQFVLCKELYSIEVWNQDGVAAIVLGSPEWSSEPYAEIVRGQGQAAAFAKGYQEMGPNILKQIHGPFAVAVTVEDKVFLAVDRLGIHALSYGLKDGIFAFGSSPRSVAAHPAFGLDLNPQAIFHFFFFSDVPSPGSIYPDVEKLQPAQYVEYSNGRLHRDFYWDIKYVDAGAPQFEELKGRFHETLENAVRRSYDGAPAAAFLSGGTDSSTVTGVLARVAGESVHTYSMGFSVDGFDEMEYARIAVKHFGATPHEFYVTPEDVLNTLPVLASAYDEPFGNESAVSSYLCASYAKRDGVKVLLAGDGGDEVFGGNERYSKQMVFEHYARIPEFFSKNILEPVIFGFPGGGALWPVRKARSYIEQAHVPLPDRLESYNHLCRTSLDSIFEPEFLDKINQDQPIAMLRESYNRAQSEHPVNRMLHLDMKFTLADNDLRKVSRTCEAAGIEVRYPLLDEALVEFAAELPPDYKVRGSHLRWFYKEALKGFLPKEIIEKQKHGFGLPFGEWALSHPSLNAEVERLTQDFMARGIIRPEYLSEVKRRHAEEHATFYGTMLWRIAMLEAWMQAHGY
ncbi:MAG: asparagine synthase-related protein [Candidatus Polarisedimenticolaceae bacterium]|nr:asparagine synthase-related protein [Candidatus Polarisedimenticolaceae bacterium]